MTDNESNRLQPAHLKVVPFSRPKIDRNRCFDCGCFMGPNPYVCKRCDARERERTARPETPDWYC